MNVTTIGIDLAKNTFSLHGVDSRGKIVFRKTLSRGKLLPFLAPRFVAPYRKGGKNDGNDAEAICEAVSRPGMRYVPVKSDEQQAILSLHRVRQGLIKERTAPDSRHSCRCRERIVDAGQKTVARHLASPHDTQRKTRRIN